MMGQAVGQQDRLFYEFNLEDRIPANHLLRRIDAVLDLNIPAKDQSEVAADGKFVRAEFGYDEDRDVCICPEGKIRKTTRRIHYGKTLYYRASKFDCERCSLKQRCCPTSPARRISRDINQKARDYTQSLVQTEAYARSRTRRKKIETLFAEVKHNLAFTRLRLRGLSGAKDAFLLTATVQNLERLARLAAIQAAAADNGMIHV